MIGDVMILAAFDHVKGAAGAGGLGRRKGFGRAFEPVARSQHASEPEDQKNGNTSQDQELQHGRVHSVL